MLLHRFSSHDLQLNLNFNRINSITELKRVRFAVCLAPGRIQNSQCTGLRKLYLSNNRVGDISALDGLSELRHLCLFRNQLCDLNRALITLRKLKQVGDVEQYDADCADSCSVIRAGAGGKSMQPG